MPVFMAHDCWVWDCDLKEVQKGNYRTVTEKLKNGRETEDTTLYSDKWLKDDEGRSYSMYEAHEHVEFKPRLVFGYLS